MRAAGPIAAAGHAGLLAGDTIVSVDGERVADWKHLRALVAARSGHEIAVVVERSGSLVTVHPEVDSRGRIGVAGRIVAEPAPMGEAVVWSAKAPARVMGAVGRWLRRTLAAGDRPDVVGSAGIAREGERAARTSWGDWLGAEAVLGGYLWPFFVVVDGVVAVAISRRARRRRERSATAGVRANS